MEWESDMYNQKEKIDSPKMYTSHEKGKRGGRDQVNWKKKKKEKKVHNLK